MTESRQANEMSRAVERFAAAVDEFARQVERLRPPEPLSEEELADLVDHEVHAVRAELWKDHKLERPAPSEEEIREWDHNPRRRTQ